MQRTKSYPWQVTEGIPDPYADQSQRTQVPDAVYEQPAPYKTEVVELGEHVSIMDANRFIMLAVN